MSEQRKLESLTMKDNFMFGAVMISPENCRPFLEMALGFPIGKLTVSTEKSLIYHPEYKGVRLDVEARDEHKRHYNVEMQVARKPYLGYRSRYYHSQIDLDLLRAGKGYGELPDVYVIFICDFDPFGFGKYLYTFRNVCQEERSLLLRDGVTTMFLSTHGKNKNQVSEGLVRFLEYVGSDLQESQEEFNDAYVRQLQEAVRQVKASREMEAKYMLFQEMLQDEREAGRAEGRAEGKAEGRAEGREEGRVEGITKGRIDSIIDLLSALPDGLPSDLKKLISAQTDCETLRRYLRLASSVNTVEEFKRRMAE